MSSENKNMYDDMMDVVNYIKKSQSNQDLENINKNTEKEEKIEEKPKPKKINKNLQKRYFKGLYLDHNNNIVASGKYSGIKPKQAAYKVLSQFYKHYNSNNKTIPEKIHIGIGEIKTNGKIFVYSGSRNSIGGSNITKNKNNQTREITYKFKNNIKKIKYLDCPELINKLKIDNLIKETGSGKRIKYIFCK